MFFELIHGAAWCQVWTSLGRITYIPSTKEGNPGDPVVSVLVSFNNSLTSWVTNLLTYRQFKILLELKHGVSPSVLVGKGLGRILHITEESTSPLDSTPSPRHEHTQWYMFWSVFRSSLYYQSYVEYRNPYMGASANSMKLQVHHTTCRKPSQTMSSCCAPNPKSAILRPKPIWYSAFRHVKHFFRPQRKQSGAPINLPSSRGKDVAKGFSPAGWKTLRSATTRVGQKTVLNGIYVQTGDRFTSTW